MNLNATLFAQFVVFFILAVFTMRFVWPPIMKVLDERAKRIADGLIAADKAKADLALTEKRVADALRGARDSAAEFRVLAEGQAAQTIEAARKEAARIISQAQQQADAAADTALQRARDVLREQVAGLVVAGAEKILRREIDAKAHSELLATIKQEL